MSRLGAKGGPTQILAHVHACRTGVWETAHARLAELIMTAREFPAAFSSERNAKGARGRERSIEGLKSKELIAGASAPPQDIHHEGYRIQRHDSSGPRRVFHGRPEDKV